MASFRYLLKTWLGLFIFIEIFIASTFSACAFNNQNLLLGANSFSLGSIWNSKFANDEISNISASYDIGVAQQNLLALRINEVIDFSTTPGVATFDVGGSVLEKKTVSAVWSDVPNDETQCGGGVQYIYDGNQYYFKMCLQKPNFVFSSSDSSVINCVGTKCTVLKAGSATVIANPVSTQAILWSKSTSDGAVWQQIKTIPLNSNSLSWELTAHEPPAVEFSVESENVAYNSATILHWNATNALSCSASGAWSGSKGLSGSESTGNLIARKDYVLTCTGVGGQIAKQVTVFAGSPTQPPTLSFGADKIMVKENESTTLHWFTSNAQICNATGDWSGNKDLNSSWNTGLIVSDKTYILTCSGPGGTVIQTLNIILDSSPPPLPNISFAADSENIAYGGAAHLYWTTENAQSCSATAGPWSGEKSTAGSVITEALFANKTFTLSCQNSAGAVASKDVTVNVMPQANLLPQISFYANGLNEPYTIEYNSSVTLKWSITNAAVCTLSGDWSGNLTMTGNASNSTSFRSSITSNKRYIITCKSPLGDIATSEVDVAVNSQPLSLTFIADSYNVLSSGSTALHWNTSGATNCVSLGDWPNTNRYISGSYSTGALYDSKIYTLNCWSTKTTFSKTTSVMVNIDGVVGEPPEIVFTASKYNVPYMGSIVLSWTANNAKSCFASGNWSGIKNVPTGLQNMSSLTSQKTYTLTCANETSSVSKSVTIQVGEAENLPTLSLDASNNPIPYQGSTVLSWSSSGAASCSSPTYNLPSVLNGVKNSGALFSNTNYKMRCYNNTAGSVIKSVDVIVGNPPTPPEITFSANKYEIPYNSNAVLSWSVSGGPAVCVASGPAEWFGTKPFSGTFYTSKLTENTSYILQCSNGAGTTSREVSINVGGSLPNIDFRADSANVFFNMPTTLRWNVENATVCSASGDWSGSKSTDGFMSTDPIKSARLYVLQCSNVNGSISKVLYVEPEAQYDSEILPQMSFWADKYSVNIGEFAKIHWTASNVDTCEASGDWSGNKGTEGSFASEGLSSKQTFVLVCKSSHGDISSEITVNINNNSTSVGGSIWADNLVVGLNETTILHWNVLNVSEGTCMADGDWSGSKSLVGSEKLPIMTETKIYRYNLNCKNVKGENVMISGFIFAGGVFASGASATLQADAYITPIGSSTMLRWMAMFATSCDLSDDTATTLVPFAQTTGSFDTGILNNTKNYFLHCVGVGGESITTLKIATSRLRMCPDYSEGVETFFYDETVPSYDLGTVYFSEDTGLTGDIDCDNPQPSLDVTNDPGLSWTSESPKMIITNNKIKPNEGDITGAVTAVFTKNGYTTSTSKILNFISMAKYWKCVDNGSGGVKCQETLHYPSEVEGEFDVESKCQDNCKKMEVIDYREVGL